MSSNIVLITNNEEIEEIIKPKLLLLREVDNILKATYKDAVAKIKKNCPDIVLIYCDDEERSDCLQLIESIKSDNDTSETIVLLVVNDYDEDFILSAYDENIADYFTLKTADSEILMRTVFGLKQNLLIKALERQNYLMKELGIINKTTNAFTNDYCDKVFKYEFDNHKSFDGILMLISASEESKTKLSPLHLANVIKESIRTSDLLTHSSANRFYVYLPKTELKGAFCVWDKIKKTVGSAYTINAALSSVKGKTFDELKNKLLNALIEAIATKQDSIIVTEETKYDSSAWLEEVNSSQKNFKLFKQTFTKKLDKVITPVFFQMQNLYEEKLFQTKIEQYSNESLSTFTLKKGALQSELKITYPGFSKINIDINHLGLDSPENSRISLNLTELDESKLTQILEDFIQEFKTSTIETATF